VGLVFQDGKPGWTKRDGDFRGRGGRKENFSQNNLPGGNLFKGSKRFTNKESKVLLRREVEKVRYWVQKLKEDDEEGGHHGGGCSEEWVNQHRENGNTTKS